MYNYQTLKPEQCEYISVGSADDIKDGERFFVDINDHSIVIFKIAGQFFAISDLCSHDNGPLEDGTLEGYEVHCPRHGARFDVRNGKVLSLPAVMDILAFPVRVRDGQIEIGLPKII